MSIKLKKVLRVISKVTLILSGLFLLGYFGYSVYLSLMAKPREVFVTNVTDSSATVSWITDSPSKGVVYYDSENSFLPWVLGFFGNSKAFDDRDVSVAQTECVKEFNDSVDVSDDFTVSGDTFDCTNVEVKKSAKYYTHHITLMNLDSESVYSFRIGDGLWSWEVENFNAVETYSTLTEVRSPNPLFGNVITEEGVAINNDGIVYFVFNDHAIDSSESVLVSSVVNDEGGWYFDSSVVRDVEGNILELEETQDTFEVMANFMSGGVSDWTEWLYGYFDGEYPDIVIKNPRNREESSQKGLKLMGEVNAQAFPKDFVDYIPNVGIGLKALKFTSRIVVDASQKNAKDINVSGKASSKADLDSFSGETTIEIDKTLEGDDSVIDQSKVSTLSEDKGDKTSVSESPENTICSSSDKAAFAQVYGIGNALRDISKCQGNNGTVTAKDFQDIICHYSDGTSMTESDLEVCINGNLNVIAGKEATQTTAERMNGVCSDDSEHCDDTLYVDWTSKDLKTDLETGTASEKDIQTEFDALTAEEKCRKKNLEMNDQTWEWKADTCARIYSNEELRCTYINGDFSSGQCLVDGKCPTGLGFFEKDGSCHYTNIIGFLTKTPSAGDLCKEDSEKVQLLNGDCVSANYKYKDDNYFCWESGDRIRCRLASGDGSKKIVVKDVGELIEIQPLPDVKGLSSSIFSVQAEESSDSEIIYIPELGMYNFQLNGENLSVEINSEETEYIFYIDSNEVAGLQFDEDEIVSTEAYNITYEKISDITQIDITEGINLISLSGLPVGREEGTFTAQDLFYESLDSDILIEYIAKFEGGRWADGYRCDTELECTGVDFDILPGTGYLIMASEDGVLNIPTYGFTTPIPVAFNPGWNLVGIHGYTQAFTARTLIDSINTISGLTADNVTWWPTSKGKYEGIQVTDEQTYGLDYPIDSENGYFVRINNFEPEDNNCKSLIWNYGGDLNGTCGNSK